MKNLIILTIFISFSSNAFSQNKLGLVTYSPDSTLVVQHYWNVIDETADSVVITGEKINYQLPVMEKAAKKYANFYQDSLSAPFDFKIITINKIWHLNENTIVIVATNESIRINSIYYSHLIFIDKKSLEVNLWITAASARGNNDLDFFVDTFDKIIILPKSDNKILEDKIFSLNIKTETFQEIKINKSNSKLLDKNIRKSKFNKSGVFIIKY